MQFTHLHVASMYSARYGTARPEELVEAQASYGATAAAITDRDGLYGAVRHIRACIAAGIAPIVGAELQLQGETPCDITVLAHGRNSGEGWAALCRVVSAAHGPARASVGVRSTHRARHLTPSKLAAVLRGEGDATTTVLLGPGSDVGQAVLAGRTAEARDLLAAWQRRLPGGIAVEIVCHHTHPGARASIQHAADMLALARSAEVPAVLTNASRYLSPDDAVTGDVLDAADRLAPLGTFVPQPNAQAWPKPPAKMHLIARNIADHAGLGHHAAADLLSATERLAARCRLDADADLRWQQPKVPEASVLGITGDPMHVLWRRVEDAIPERFPNASAGQLQRIRERLRLELGTIEGFGFATYFLTVADVVDVIRARGIRAQARGSGAGSLVNYLLRISNVEPLEHDLVFERFLGHKRETLPDIDVDVESARRHEVYRAIFERYSDTRVTLLSMQNRYRARGASRDAGLALGFDEEQIDQIAKSLWRFNAREFRAALETKPELREVAALVQADPKVDMLVDLTERLDRLPRHISMHPCGVILSDNNLLSVTPVQPTGIGLPMSQFDKDDVDDVGLIKLDVLGVRMQSTIAYTLDEIQRMHGPQVARVGDLPVDAPYLGVDGRIDIDAIPHDDEPTFEAIRTTHTLGMFQIESPGQRELIGKMQPDQYEDLIADISLFRPGPMKGNMVGPYIDTKLGFMAPDYLHPRFEWFLRDSYGVVIYHEHVLRILHDCMDISLADADVLRRRMEKDMESIKRDFFTRTRARVDERGRRIFTDRDIDRIWKVLEGFGSFGFCKAHGAAFALPTYQTAWLKTHFGPEFMAGILEHDPGMYPKRMLVTEVRRMGIPLLPLDVNVSTDSYVVEWVERGEERERGIRLALRDVHGISDAELARILSARESGPYRSISDFYVRARPGRPLMRRLAAVGAFDSLVEGERRGDILAYVRQLTAKPRPDAQPENELDFDRLDELPEGTPSPTAIEQLASDLAVFSAEVHGHVIDPYRPLLQHLGVVDADRLVDLRGGTEVLVAGIRVATQTPPMRSGQRVVFISVDDGRGIADCTFFPDAQEQVGPLLFGTQLMVIKGKTRRTGERGVSILAEDAYDLKQLWARYTSLAEQPGADVAWEYQTA